MQAVAQWLKTKTSDREIPFRPARVLMQDFTGVPAVVDLAAMRDAMKTLGGDPEEDQSAGAGRSRHRPFGGGQLTSARNAAFKKNVEEEYRQNQERYEFLKWSQKSFDNFRVVPPGTGICHQVNLEYLSQTVWTKKDKVKIDGKADGRSTSPIPTRWSAPTRTPPWSTAWRCSAGASAASRRKPRCSASPIRCCCRK